jgi:hypothetical protein
MRLRLRLRRRADHGSVFAHGRQRYLVAKGEDAIPQAEPADLVVGRITTLVAGWGFSTEGRDRTARKRWL